MSEILADAMVIDDAQRAPLCIATLHSAGDLKSRWNQADLLVPEDRQGSNYVAGFANSDRCVDLALRLRYEVFNVELGEGLAQSSVTGHDRDEFDEQMTHIVLYHNPTGRIVGTYRTQTIDHAFRNKGIYASQLFQLGPIEPYFPKTIELGRACLAQDHRSLQAILALWTGIGDFMNLFDQKYLFGCCSLTTQDPDDGWRAMKTIRAKGHLHTELFVSAQPTHKCGLPTREFDADLGPAIRLPKLFRTYMGLCAKVVSEPAIDRDFGTVDFLILMNGKQVNLSKLDIIK